MNENVDVKFKLVSIYDEQYMPKSIEKDLSIIDGGALSFQYKIDTIIKMVENEILVIPHVRYAYKGEELFEANVTVKYSILNMDSAVSLDEEKNMVNFNADILPSLIGSAYSTLRGIVYVRTYGTSIGKFPLPMIEVKTLIEKMGLSVAD